MNKTLKLEGCKFAELHSLVSLRFAELLSVCKSFMRQLLVSQELRKRYQQTLNFSK